MAKKRKVSKHTCKPDGAVTVSERYHKTGAKIGETTIVYCGICGLPVKGAQTR